MPINKPMIPNPQRAKVVIKPDGTRLTMRKCVKCDGVFYVEDGEKQTRCEGCRKRKAEMIGMEGGQMSGAGPRGGVDPDFDVVAYRVRIAKLTDAQLIEEGKYYRRVVGFKLQPHNPRFEAMLGECIAEWRRRHRKLRLQAINWSSVFRRTA